MEEIPCNYFKKKSYFPTLILEKGHNSMCFYAIDTISGEEVSLKF